MTSFLIAAALVLAVSLALLARPWWRRQCADTESRRALNTAIYRDQLIEIERDRSAGQLSEVDSQEARGELQRRLLDDAAEADAPLIAPAHPKRTLIALLVTLPVAAVGLYAWLGNPAALNQMARGDFSQADVDKMVAGLAAKLENEPDNLQGWAMLARSYKAMHRPADAERAFEKAIAFVEKDPQLLSEYADLLASKTGNLSGRPEQLIAQALALDPDHLQSLWLAGTAAFNRNDYTKAVEHWQRALRQLPPDSEDAQMLSSIIGEAKQKMGAGKVSAGSASLRGRIELAAALKAQAAPSDTVFIVAREVGGGPMPLAAKRVRVADLPVDFTLDDGDALSPARNLSSAKSVQIEARISKSGDAKSQPGDLSGTAGPVKPGAKGLRLSIDKVVQ
jgi:cytochrome c-type biogenesis protein CcmH